MMKKLMLLALVSFLFSPAAFADEGSISIEKHPADAELAELGRAAKLDSGYGDKWLDAVRRHTPASNNEDLKASLQGVVGAFREYRFSYWLSNGARIELGKVMNSLQGPEKFLRTRVADCRDMSLLAAATLAQLGFEPALVVSTHHVFPVVLLDPKSSEGMLLRGGDGLRILPLEVTFLQWDRQDLIEIMRGGLSSFAHASLIPGTWIVDLRGRILWRNTAGSLSKGEPSQTEPRP